MARHATYCFVAVPLITVPGGMPAVVFVSRKRNSLKSEPAVIKKVSEALARGPNVASRVMILVAMHVEGSTV